MQTYEKSQSTAPLSRVSRAVDEEEQEVIENMIQTLTTYWRMNLTSEDRQKTGGYEHRYKTNKPNKNSRLFI